MVKESIRNYTSSESKQYREYLLSSYSEFMEKININIEKIMNLIKRSDALALLQYAFIKLVFQVGGKHVDSQFSTDEVVVSLTLEYIENMLPEIEMPDVVKNEIEISVIYDEILRSVKELQGIIPLFFISHCIKNNYDYIELFFIQLQWSLIRKNRYFNHDILHLRNFLLPHNDIIQNTFQVDAEKLITEIEKIMKTLMGGFSESLEKQQKIHNDFLQYMDSLENNSATADELLHNFFVNNPEKESEFLYHSNRVNGYDLFDIQKVTDLPVELLEFLSYNLGERQGFLSKNNFYKWFFSRKGLQEKPFIKIKNKYYCFNYQALADGFYRCIQRIILARNPDYQNTWKYIQTEVSESLSVKLFMDILPGARFYKNIRYQWPLTSSKKKNWCECDAIIIYDDHLFILEIKSGVFTYLSPTIDMDSYKESVRNLIKRPSEQSQRFINYLNSSPTVPIYEEKNGKKIELVKIHKNEIRIITSVGITLDNLDILSIGSHHLDGFETKIENHAFWSLSLDNLYAYAEIFRSPIIFCHYIEQRNKARLVSSLRAVDEYEEIGKYFYYNDYSQYVKENCKEDLVMISGLRDNIDKFFHDKMVSADKISPPEQARLPGLYKKIFSCIEKSNELGKARIGSLLLNYDGEIRNSIAEDINNILKNFFLSTGIEYLQLKDTEESFLIGIVTDKYVITDKEINEYVRLNFSNYETKNLSILILYFSNPDSLIKAEWKFFSYN